MSLPELKNRLLTVGRWSMWTFFGLLALYAVARPSQIYLQSQYNGDRGPYLQMLGEDRVTLRWQTRKPMLTRFAYGIDPSALNFRGSDEVKREEHSVTLRSLKPETRYFYRVERAEGFPEETFWFDTAPKKGEDRPVRLWIQGDPGIYRNRAELSSAGAIRWMLENPLDYKDALFDLWLTTGDNAYKSGTNVEFQRELFAAYPEILPYYPYWPAYGNHDSRRWAFFDLFEFPEQGELGGVASGTENYFSFNYANLHLIYLDSEGSNLDRVGEMGLWLQRDLQANRQMWTIAIIHHPPYSKSSHDSDDNLDSWGRMGRVREEIVPILEQYGVDMLITGHSHSYERSHLLRCHYGNSLTFDPEMMIVDAAPPYQKGSGRLSGTLYAVVGGSSKQSTSLKTLHPAIVETSTELGSMVIDINAISLSGYYVNQHGEVVDQFTLIKGDNEGTIVGCN